MNNVIAINLVVSCVVFTEAVTVRNCGVLRDFAKFTGKHIVSESFF